MRNEAYLTASKLAEKIGSITKDGVRYHLDQLQANGVIKHKGPSRGGYWVIEDL